MHVHHQRFFPLVRDECMHSHASLYIGWGWPVKWNEPRIYGRFYTMLRKTSVVFLATRYFLYRVSKKRNRLCLCFWILHTILNKNFIAKLFENTLFIAPIHHLVIFTYIYKSQQLILRIFWNCEYTALGT